MISDVNSVVAALASGQRKGFFFPSVTTVAGRHTDMNAAGVGRYGQMATPAAASAGGTLHADGDVGFPWFNDAGGGNDLALLCLTASLQTPGALNIYERIWSCSGLSGTSNTAQSITGFPALTIPDVDGTELEMFAEVYTQIGAVGAALSVSYTNSGGTAGRTAAGAVGATGLREVFRLIPLTLQGTDTGVKSIQSATLSVSTGTAGSWGLVLARRLACIQSPIAFAGEVMDFARLGMPKVDPSAALMFDLVASTTTSGVIDGMFVLGEG